MAEGIRRRHVGAAGDDRDEPARGLDRLRAFDVYAKVHDDCIQKSQSGGIVSVVVFFIIAILFWTELVEFLTVPVVDTVDVDTRINQRLSIVLNVTFPHLRCDEVSVDPVDSAGDNQVDVHGSIEKVPLDLQGRLVASEDPVVKENDCLPCLEASSVKQCCNSCQELKEAYIAADLPYFHILDTAPQCRNSIGCRIDGRVVVNKVSGNVHVALGRSTVREGKHIHEFNMHDVSDGFNTSHEIHYIGFGDDIPGLRCPLDGTQKIVRHGAYMFHYYIKLVPTVYIDRWGVETFTNQYSFTDSARNVQVRDGELSGLPGVFIVYDFSPFLMVKTEKAKPWSYICTSMCAIIGGVFSMASLIELCVQKVIGVLGILDGQQPVSGEAELKADK